MDLRVNGDNNDYSTSHSSSCQNSQSSSGVHGNYSSQDRKKEKNFDVEYTHISSSSHISRGGEENKMEDEHCVLSKLFSQQALWWLFPTIQ